MDWKPARHPQRIALEGASVTLEPVDPARHTGALYSAADGAPAIWDYLPYGPFENREAFIEWLEARAASDDPLFYALVDRAAGAARGMASYLRMDSPNGVIEIGHIWFAPVMQRTRQATESIFVLARHAFDDLGYRRLEWKCDSLNAPSRRAAKRFGFVYEGVFRQHMVIKGRNRDTAWYAMTDGDWPLRRAAFEAWLAPDNFNSAGRQRESLSALRAQLEGDGAPAA
ncbi:MAG TPA: GNAT family protein [Candidatus Dormibacteraeota bacterium]|nr:GNAT family protein [Candidatus Dormibacteraeota bacterium]